MIFLPASRMNMSVYVLNFHSIPLSTLPCLLKAEVPRGNWNSPCLLPTYERSKSMLYAFNLRIFISRIITNDEDLSVSSPSTLQIASRHEEEAADKHFSKRISTSKQRISSLVNVGGFKSEFTFSQLYHSPPFFCEKHL